MAFYCVDDSEFWKSVTPECLQWSVEAAEAAGMELASIPLGDVADPDVAMVSLLRLEPNAVVPRHSHACHRVELVIRGSLRVDGGRVVTPGDVMISGPGEYYGPHVAGPEGALTAEIFSAANTRTIFAEALEPDVIAQIERGRAVLERAERAHERPLHGAT